jgi:hypothetical protein
MGTLAVGTLPARAAETDPRDDASPWGIGSGAEWSGDYPKFNPMLAQGGVRWIRLFTEWGVIQPKQGQWHWKVPDAMVADTRANHIHQIGIWAFFAPWASADGGTRKGPIKEMQSWRDYVTATVSRYQKDIKYWEVWNEFNGSFYVGKNKVKDYADLTVAAYDAAKKADPTVQVGMSVASSDIGFLDLVIKAGAANHFDYLCIHPYENLGAMIYGDEMGYLGLGDSVRQMLAANQQRTDIPVWITEVGDEAPVKADAQRDARQAEWLAKSYLLAFAQGIQRVCWFEVRGPAYGSGTDFGVIRADWSPRPSYVAYKTMTALLGEEPKYLGWVNLGTGGHGFLFQGAKGPVLAAWALPGMQGKAACAAAVRVTDLMGQTTTLAAGSELKLTHMPVLLRDLPADLVAEAQANQSKPFPWGGDYAQAKAIACHLGATNVDEGLRQVFLRPEHEGHSVAATVEGAPCRRIVSKDKDNDCAYFRADTHFVPFGPRALDITVVARRAAPDQAADLALTYETLEGYKDFQKGGEHWTIPAGDGWQEHTWHVRDACFANKWGWHLGLMASGPAKEFKEFLVKEVRITKPQPAAP